MEIFAQWQGPMNKQEALEILQKLRGLCAYQAVVFNSLKFTIQGMIRKEYMEMCPSVYAHDLPSRQRKARDKVIIVDSSDYVPLVLGAHIDEEATERRKPRGTMALLIDPRDTIFAYKAMDANLITRGVPLPVIGICIEMRLNIKLTSGPYYKDGKVVFEIPAPEDRWLLGHMVGSQAAKKASVRSGTLRVETDQVLAFPGDQLDADMMAGPNGLLGTVLYDALASDGRDVIKPLPDWHLYLVTRRPNAETRAALPLPARQSALEVPHEDSRFDALQVPTRLSDTTVHNLGLLYLPNAKQQRELAAVIASGLTTHMNLEEWRQWWDSDYASFIDNMSFHIPYDTKVDLDNMAVIVREEIEAALSQEAAIQRETDIKRLRKLRDNLAKLIGEPIVPPGFIERMRDEIRTIAVRLKG